MEGSAVGQVHHGSATTTAAIRRAIQHSQASLRGLARRYGINPKTVAKWKRREDTPDLHTRPRAPPFQGTSGGQGAIIGAVRRATLLPPGVCSLGLPDRHSGVLG